jgi:hypothetical protein
MRMRHIDTTRPFEETWRALIGVGSRIVTLETMTCKTGEVVGQAVDTRCANDDIVLRWRCGEGGVSSVGVGSNQLREWWWSRIVLEGRRVVAGCTQQVNGSCSVM